MRERKIAFRALLLAVLLAAGALLSLPARAESEDDWDLPPASLAKRSRQEGQIDVYDYYSDGDGGHSVLCGVYTPPGYDPQGCYDVVFLWPGTQNNYRDALLHGYPVPMDDGKIHTVLGRPLLDKMIEEGLVRPFVLVCMEDFPGTEPVTAGFDISRMLRLVREKYAVYGADDSLPPEEVREHYTLIGYSQGSIYVEGEGMVHLYDRFANFAAFSFGSRWNEIPRLLDESPYPLGYFYALVGGKDDHGAELGRKSFEIISQARSVRVGENALFRETENYGHGYELMILGLYDFLPRILPPLETTTEGNI